VSEPGDLFAAVAADFSARVHGTSDWSAESPCEGWSARDLVVHVITMFRSVTAWANGVDRVEVTADEDVVVAWDSANADLKAVLADPAVCAAVFPTPFGPMPVDQMIDQLISLEILAHTWDLSRATVAVQGFGNVGSVSADLLSKDGAKIVAVSDVTGGVHDRAGLDVPSLLRWAADHRGVAGFPGAKPLTTSIVEYPCDILIPAALENQITSRNAGRIKARVIAEAANGPTTPEADAELFRRGVFMIPDILCNAGGVTVSYFEWVQDLNRDHWSEIVVNEKLHGIMVKAFAETLEIAERDSIDMRTAAYLLAVDRVADAMDMRGLYP
jgi:hypothetical protein